MKHALKVTLVIIAMFLVAQFIGLAVISSYDNHFGASAQKARQEAIEKGLPVPPEPEISFVKGTIPPPMELKTPIDVASILISIVIALVIATALFFLLSRIRVTLLLRIWFAFVVFICLSIALTLIIYPMTDTNLFGIFGRDVSIAEAIALPLALILTFYKVIKRNILVHNFTELLIYPGLAVIFLPLLNVVAAAILLVLISIYDMWAVWKSKYMIKLAKYQMNEMKVFAGFFVPYVSAKDRVKIQKMRALARREKSKKGKRKGKMFRFKVQIAALGGGDVAFPLIFAGTIMLAFGLLAAMITILCTTIALGLLLWFSKKGKFYPAMPFLSAGCFLGLILVLLIF